MEWKPIATAPFDRDLELAVIDSGEPHVFAFPCHHIIGGWVDVKTKKQINIHPTHWREWPGFDFDACSSSAIKTQSSSSIIRRADVTLRKNQRPSLTARIL